MGVKRDQALSIARLTKHQYYYKPQSGKKRGRKPSQHTSLLGKGAVPNAKVVAEMKSIQSDADTNYGYQRMAIHLKLKGYDINAKKVHRIMKQADLLKEKFRAPVGKNYARYRIVTPTRPLEVIEIDIKVVWVAEHRQNAYILTILDTFTRTVLYWQVGYQMKEWQVRKAWQSVIEQYLQPHDLLRKNLHIEVRNDNGPQFVAKKLREFLAENHLNQVFTHPYTPQENGHIESFHQILSDALTKQPFWSLVELENRLHKFYHTYNHVRLHGSIAKLPPILFWECWNNGLINRKEVAKRKIHFKLNIPYQQLSGIKSLKGVLCLSGYANKNNPEQTEVMGPQTPNHQPSVQKSPSVVLC